LFQKPDLANVVVLVIENWNLDIVCYLFFGAWDLSNSSALLGLKPILAFNIYFWGTTLGLAWRLEQGGGPVDQVGPGFLLVEGQFRQAEGQVYRPAAGFKPTFFRNSN